MMVKFSTSPNVCFRTTWEMQNKQKCVKMNKKCQKKNIHNIIFMATTREEMASNLKKDHQILIIFGTNVLDTPGHQTTV